MNAAFNLLRYPQQARQRRLRWRLLSSLAGVGVGLLLGGMAIYGLRLDQEALVAEHEKLQARSVQRHAQAGSDKLRQEALTTAQARQGRLAQVQQQQQLWLRLYQALVQEAGHGGWVLERLQVDGERLELQGRTREAHTLAAAQARLSETLQSPLALVSLVVSNADPSERQAGEHVFVWQGPWPALSMPPVRRLP